MIIQVVETWSSTEPIVCNFYIFPYILCGDILRLSFLLLSFDRLLAIMNPSLYNKIVTRNFYTITITIIWLIVTITDVIPFLPSGRLPNDEGCTYIRSYQWNLFAIIVFNIIPFFFIAVNHFSLWIVARKMEPIDESPGKKSKFYHRPMHCKSKKDSAGSFPTCKQVNKEMVPVQKIRDDEKHCHHSLIRKESYCIAMQNIHSSNSNLNANSEAYHERLFNNPFRSEFFSPDDKDTVGSETPRLQTSRFSRTFSCPVMPSTHCVLSVSIVLRP